MEMKLAPIKWVENGFTIGYSGGKTVFCTGGIPGKEQKFTIEKETSHFIYARAESVESDCPAFPICGGCSYRHIPYSEELALKSKQIYDRMYILKQYFLSLKDTEIVFNGREKAPKWAFMKDFPTG